MVIVLVVLVVGLALGVASTLRLVQWRPGGGALENDDASEIRDGEVITVTGMVRLVGEPLISPLSARRCVVYETFASLYEEPPATADDAPPPPRALVAQLADRAMVPFELLTSLGVILVDATEADLELSPTPVYPRRPEREAKFLRERDRDERLIETTTFEEVTVDPESLVSVRGKAVVESPTRIRLVPEGDQPVRIGVPRRREIDAVTDRF